MSPEQQPRKHILLVEDDVATRDALVFILKAEGYRVTSAADGRQALEQLGNITPPNLILLDLLLPGMDSAEFHKQIKADPKLAAVPVVVVSAAADVREKAAELHAADCLEKSADLGVLLETIRRHCT